MCYIEISHNCYLLLVFPFHKSFAPLGCRSSRGASLASMDLRNRVWSMCAAVGLVLIVGERKWTSQSASRTSGKSAVWTRLVLKQSRAVIKPGRFLASTAGTTVWDTPDAGLWVSSRVQAPPRSRRSPQSNPLTHSLTHGALCPRRFSPGPPRARALLGRSLPTRPGAAKPAQTEQRAGRGPLRFALHAQPDRALSVLW